MVALRPSGSLYMCSVHTLGPNVGIIMTIYRPRAPRLMEELQRVAQCTSGHKDEELLKRILLTLNRVSQQGRQSSSYHSDNQTVRPPAASR